MIGLRLETLQLLYLVVIAIFAWGLVRPRRGRRRLVMALAAAAVGWTALLFGLAIFHGTLAKVEVNVKRYPAVAWG